MATKLILRVPTLGSKAGDEIQVADADTAEELVRNGTARKPTPASKSKES